MTNSLPNPPTGDNPEGESPAETLEFLRGSDVGELSEAPQGCGERYPVPAAAHQPGAGTGVPGQGRLGVPREGRLVLAGTPIGNAADASARLRDLLQTADVVAAEDTRRLFSLATRIGVRVGGRVVSFYEHNEADRSDDLLDQVATGATVVVVSDAGMPSISDPGFRVVRRAVERGLPVTVAPGPSAVLAALALSGLPSDRFCFEGFVPRKAGERATALGALAGEPRTMVFFEAPHRLAATVAAMLGAFGADRPAAIARELTKTYEQVIRGPLSELAARVAGEELRGEICIVVGGAPAVAVPVQDAVPQVLARVDAGERLKDVVADVAAQHGLRKKELYDAATDARRSRLA